MAKMSFKEIYLKTMLVALGVMTPWVLYHSRLILLSTLIGVGLATLMNPIVTWLDRKWGFNRFVAAIILLFSLTILFSLAFILMGSVLAGQYDSLKESLPTIVDSWEGKWQHFKAAYPHIKMLVSGNSNIGLADKLIPIAKEIVQSFMGFFTGLSLALVIALFTMANSKKYFEGFLAIFDAEKKETIRENLIKSARILRRWFKAQFIDMLAVFFLTSIGMFAAGIDYWFIYGILAGTLSIVPFVGIIIVVIFASAVVLVQQPDKIGWLLAVFLITQQLEGNFILPKLMRDNVQTPAALLIFTMIFAGAWLGPLGVFVTPPALAITVAITKKYVLCQRVAQ